MAIGSRVTSAKVWFIFSSIKSQSETPKLAPAWNRSSAEGAGLRELHSLLLDLDPGKTWGNLRRVLTPTGDYLWLCPTHYREYDPGLPVLT